MKEEIIHLIKTALTDLKRSKTRTFLTSLGITIGVMSVVMLIALGLGLKNYIQQQFESLGANLVMIMPGSGFGGESGMSSGAGMVGGGISFDEKDLATLKRIDGIKYLVPMFYKSGRVEGAGNEKVASIMGVSEDYFSLMNSKALAGEVFTKTEAASKAKVAVVGYTLADNLFDQPQDAVGKTIRISNQRYKVIAVLEKLGDPDQDSGVVIPYKTTFGSLNPNKTFWTIYLGVENKDDVERIKEEAKTALLKRYDKDDFSVTEQSEILSTVDQIFSILNTVLVAIGSISLLVGGIGIMNIMYATVTERIKEVGIRRAVGATERDILLQFLTESLILSIFGGLMGLILSIIIVLIIRIFFPASINVFSVVVTLAISSAIGIFFGVFPARKAAKLPPIEAIRNE